MVDYITDDIFNTSCKIIAHSVNTKKVFGAGLAKQIAQRYPEVKKAYMTKSWDLGEIQLVPIYRNRCCEKIIANLAMQSDYGRDTSRVYTDYGAAKQSLSLLFRYASCHWYDVALPRIGTGLGQGEPKVMENIIYECLEKTSPDLHVVIYTLPNSLTQTPIENLAYAKIAPQQYN